MKPRRKDSIRVVLVCVLVIITMVFILNVMPALAKCTIYGQVRSSKDGKPLAGATVTAYDSDTGKDQKMGSATTDGNGNYRITYRDGCWDCPKIKNTTQWRPDIYIKATAPDHKGKESKKYNNHKLKYDLRIDVSLQYMSGARTVQGKIVDSSNRPVAGALVTACDADPLKDERMGTALTDNAGNYKIPYRDGAWDGEYSKHHTQWRPDIYVVVSKDNYKKLKSKTYSDHKLKDQLNINAKLQNKPGKTFPSGKDMCNWKMSDAARCKAKGPDHIWLGPEGRLGRCTKLRKEVHWVKDKYNALKPHVQAYIIYFETIVGSGATERYLPGDVKNKLRGHYGNVVNKIKYASSKHTWEKNGMTDCHSIYFPAGSRVVAELKNGRIFEKGNGNKLQWLLHEMNHAKQCEAWGGRFTYADKWFGQAGGEVLDDMVNLRLKSITFKKIHDAMPMEANAERNANQVMQKLGYVKYGNNWVQAVTASAGTPSGKVSSVTNKSSSGLKRPVFQRQKLK